MSEELTLLRQAAAGEKWILTWEICNSITMLICESEQNWRELKLLRASKGEIQTAMKKTQDALSRTQAELGVAQYQEVGLNNALHEEQTLRLEAERKLQVLHDVFKEVFCPADQPEAGSLSEEKLSPEVTQLKSDMAATCKLVDNTTKQVAATTIKFASIDFQEEVKKIVTDAMEKQFPGYGTTITKVTYGIPLSDSEKSWG